MGSIERKEKGMTEKVEMVMVCCQLLTLSANRGDSGLV